MAARDFLEKIGNFDPRIFRRHVRRTIFLESFVIGRAYRATARTQALYIARIFKDAPVVRALCFVNFETKLGRKSFYLSWHKRRQRSRWPSRKSHGLSFDQLSRVRRLKPISRPLDLPANLHRAVAKQPSIETDGCALL
jgi:hypothetical protein